MPGTLLRACTAHSHLSNEAAGGGVLKAQPLHGRQRLIPRMLSEATIAHPTPAHTRAELHQQSAQAHSVRTLSEWWACTHLSWSNETLFMKMLGTWPV
jgi:hypothetical protein